MKTFILIAALIITLYFFYRHYQEQNFRKNLAPGKHCRVFYNEDRMIGFILKVTDDFVRVDVQGMVIDYPHKEIKPL